LYEKVKIKARRKKRKENDPRTREEARKDGINGKREKRRQIRENEINRKDIRKQEIREEINIMRSELLLR
jgi:hypothetical protein